MVEFLSGKLLTYIIMSLYALRCVTYVATGHYGPGAYWLGALWIVLAAEFLMPRFP